MDRIGLDCWAGFRGARTRGRSRRYQLMRCDMRLIIDCIECQWRSKIVPAGCRRSAPLPPGWAAPPGRRERAGAVGQPQRRTPVEPVHWQRGEGPNQERGAHPTSATPHAAPWLRHAHLQGGADPRGRPGAPLSLERRHHPGLRPRRSGRCPGVPAASSPDGETGTVSSHHPRLIPPKRRMLRILRPQLTLV